MHLEDDSESRQCSVLQGDGFYFNRILSRESSVGQSSRIYYRRAEGVPFNWEMQPGTPKNLPGEEIIPPLSLPPLVQSMGLPRPCVDQPKRPNQSKGGNFWKKIKIIYQERSVQTSRERGTVDPTLKLPKEGFQTAESDAEFVATLNNSFSSSSSPSSSSNSTHAMEPSSVRRESLDAPFYCSPWNITAVLVRATRRT